MTETCTYTANDICRAIDALDKQRAYGYITPRNRGEIRIIKVDAPEGPVTIRRRQTGERWGRDESISSEMLWRVANALDTRNPVNVDRVLAGSYNTRSVLEALLAHTPYVYVCYPGRLEIIAGRAKTKRGHKHILLCPNTPHELGKIEEKKLGEDCVIREIPSYSMMYDVAPVPLESAEIPIEVRRRHSQIQVALAEIAHAMEMRTWIAVQDQGIVHRQKRIIEYPFIVKDLAKEGTILSFPQAVSVARNIDCLFFNGGLPFALEIEHSTGVTSGLARLMNFKNYAPHLNTNFVIVADDNERFKVLKEAAKSQFESLRTFYFPYSQVEDLYAFITRRKGMRLKGTKREEFLLNFMEKTS